MLGVVDPNNNRGVPPQVAACAGLDVLSHAVESLTALPFCERPAPESPAHRPAYQGSNPISDIWARRAIEMVARYLVRSMTDPSDDEAHGAMLLAATFAGIGFGNAGVHLPHGMSYPVSGMVRDFVPAGYRTRRPLIPHGMSVILNSPAVFRFTAPADPQRHLEAARLMGADVAESAKRRRGRDPRQRDHRPHAANRNAQRAQSRGLRTRRRRCVSRRHDRATPCDQAFPSSCK